MKQVNRDTNQQGIDEKTNSGLSGLRIAITGTGGRLGGALERIYSSESEVVAFDRASLDLGDTPKLREILESTPFDILINPAAMTSVDQCETEKAAAAAVNTFAPGVMAEICRTRGARFIHVSTDYVFDGKKPGLRSEEDPAVPLGVYGKTKKEGEDAVLSNDPSALVVRTSWVFGRERPAFPDSIIGRALSGGKVEAIADKWSSPTFADDFARYLKPLLVGADALSGILHLCNSGSCTWQEYGQVALDCASEFGLDLKAREVEPISLDQMTQFLIPRPVYTSMDTSHYRAAGEGTPRPWQEALREYISEQIACGKFLGR